MTKQEMLNKIMEMAGAHKYPDTISFWSESKEPEDIFFFQYSGRVWSPAFEEFVDYNFEWHKVKEITRIEVSPYGCINVYGN